MSRIGKNPVTIPNGVTVSVDGFNLTAKGPKGEVTVVLPPEASLEQKENEITFTPKSQSKLARAQWGTARALTNSAVLGAANGYEQKLKLIGVGYRANMQGTKLNLSLGFSHPVVMDIPQGLTVVVNDNTEIVVNGADKHALGQFCANVRSKRPPEPFKGKGVRYADEYVAMKEGKKK